MKYQKKIREFKPWMIEKMKEHLAEGWSFQCFVGRYGISSDQWYGIVKQSNELQALRDEYRKRQKTSLYRSAAS